MYLSLTDVSFWLYGVFFLFASFVTWFIPGWVVLSQISWKGVALKATLALPVGVALWGMQGFVFGYLGLRVLTFLYLFVFTVLFLQQQRHDNWKSFRSLWQSIRSTPLWLSLSLFGATALQVFAHVGSGLRTSQGIMYYFVNSVDGMMHLAYIQEIAQRFPPQEPGAIGLPLQNYHYWSDLVLADIHRVWQIPIIHLFFQFAPVMIGLWSMILVVQLIKYLGGNRKSIFVALFLLSLGADASYMLTQVLHGTWGTAVASLDSGPTFFFNIPQVFARFIFLGSILLTLESWQRKSWKLIGLTCVVIASLFGFKVYYALYAVFGFCSLVAFEVLKTFFQYLRKNSLLLSVRHIFSQHMSMVLAVGVLAALSLLIYFPTNRGAGGLTYSYFEWPRRLLSAENIDYADWFLRMQVYEEAGNIRNIFIFNLWAIFLTFLAIYGTRMLGLLPLFRMKAENWIRMFVLLVPANLLFIVLGLFTLQTSGGLNIFNFLIVPILSFNIFAAFSLARLSNKVFLPLFVIFVMATLPRSILQISDFWSRYRDHQTDLVITNQHLEAFAYLREQAPERAIVQGLITSEEDEQNRLSLYIPFFSQRDSYVGGISMLNSHNQPTEERIEQVKQAVTAIETASNSAELKNLGIDYLFIPSEEADRFAQNAVFANEAASIFEIQ